MTPIQSFKSRAGAAIAVLAATVAAAAVLASPAAAASASGQAFLRPAGHDKGRTLSGQGVKIVAGTGAGSADGMLTLPLDSLAASSAGSSASLSFERGKRSLALTGISFDLAAGTLNGTLGGRQLAVFELGTAAQASASSASLQDGKLSLTGPAAGALKKALGLERALARNGVGMVWLAAAAEEPKPAPSEPAKPIQPSDPIKPIDPVQPNPKPVVAGSVDWGFLSSWRSYVLLSPPAGSAEVSAGATATGPLTSPTTIYGFPATGGSYTAAHGAAAAELTLASKGSVKWAKPGHMINEVRLTDLEVQFGSAGGWLIADVSTDFGAPEATQDVKFASLDPSAVTPTIAPDSVTWTGVPATLTAAGAASFSGFYEAGKQLEPITVTAGLG